MVQKDVRRSKCLLGRSRQNVLQTKTSFQFVETAGVLVRGKFTNDTSGNGQIYKPVGTYETTLCVLQVKFMFYEKRSFLWQIENASPLESFLLMYFCFQLLADCVCSLQRTFQMFKTSVVFHIQVNTHSHSILNVPLFILSSTVILKINWFKLFILSISLKQLYVLCTLNIFSNHSFLI